MGVIASHLLERESTFEAIQGLLADGSAGRGRALFVIGEAGLGKTSVLEHAIQAAGDAFHIGVGRGDAVEAMLPFGLLAQALGPVLASDEVLDGLLEPSGDSSVARRFWSILRRLQQTAVQPLLIALDDLQWADPDSLALIHLLCRRIPAFPLALIAAARPWPDVGVRLAEQLHVDGFGDVTRLAPLSPVAATALFRARAAQDASDQQVEHALELCAGNPLLLIQLAEMFDSYRHSENPAQDQRQRFMLARFLGISEVERRYVRAASVLGTRFRASPAAEIAGVDDRHTADVLDALFQAGLLHEAADGWAEFGHALIRQALYEDISAPARVHLHQVAFHVLLARNLDAAEAAEHAIAGHLTADIRAIETVARAGREALRGGAVRAARRYFEAAVELAGESASPELLVELAGALILDGANEAATDVDERVLRSWSLTDSTRATALSQLGRAAFMSGRLERAAVAFEAVAQIPNVEPDVTVSALLDYAFWTWACLGPGHALPVATRARDVAVDAAPQLRACTDAAWGLCAYGVGDPLGATVAAAAGSITELSGVSLHWALEPAGVPGDVAVWAEDFDEAECLFMALLRSAERRSDPFTLFHAAFSWTDGLCRLGRLEEALALCARVFEVAEVAPMVLPFAFSARALVLLELGQLQQAEHWCAKLGELATDQRRWFLVVGYALHRQGTLAWRGGHLEEACAAFGQLEEMANGWGLSDPSTIPWAADAISAYAGRGRWNDAQRIIDWVAPRAAVLPSLWPRVVVANGRAAMAEHAGDFAAAELHHAEAYSLQDRLKLPLYRAETLTQYGAFLLRRGDPARARPILAEALRLSEQHGADWHAARARAEWRRAGGRARHTLPGDLTPQEAAVANLARAGHTNRQIAQQLYLSENTVETHLAHVYRKLGIRRRWQLIARPDLRSRAHATALESVPRLQ